MARPATSHLGRLIDDYQRRHSAGLGGLADRIGVTRQTLRQWRLGELRSMPAQENLSAAAAEIGCTYPQILQAALRDAGYLSGEAGDTAFGSDVGNPADAARPFIQDAVLKERYNPTSGNWLCETSRGPAVWTVAHRGYSGSRRLDLWAYSDEQSALRAAARLALDCGLDEDPLAVKAFERREYRSVVDRYRETVPEWQVLSVGLTPFIDRNGDLLITSFELERRSPPTSDPQPDLNEDVR